MRTRSVAGAARAVVAAGLLLALLVTPAEGHERPCDRACLNGLVDRYLDAVIAHDPGRLPLADDVTFTENGQRLELGDGLWRTMSSTGSYRLFVTDPAAGQVAFIGTIRERGDAPGAEIAALIALRLDVDGDQIREIETLVVREPEAAANVEALGRPNAKFTTPVPEAERPSRRELIETANRYFSGMQRNDGMGDSPFAADCNRIENGTRTTNAPGVPAPDPRTSSDYSIAWSCLEQFESGLLHFVTRIRDRRFVAVDERYGLVFSFVFFDHAAGDTRTFTTPDGRTVTAGPTEPWTWQIAELFKVEGGLIHQVEAILHQVPYGMNSGWSSWEDGMSDQIQDVTGADG